MSTADHTRQRILDAATEEFAAHGIAGARVDRIAARSGASKPMLYSYYGGKERLFEAVFAAHVLDNIERIPFTADDLPGYAARLYDGYLADPALARLVEWKRMEREPDGYLYTGREDVDERHLAAIVEQQQAGAIRSDLAPEDVWSLVIASAATWSQLSLNTVARRDEDESVHERRRRAVAAMVRGGLTTT